MRILLVPALAAAVCFTLTGGCATAGAGAPRGAPPATAQSLVGDAACDTDAQCRTIGIGHKACGGPASYVAWSTLRTDAARLRDAVEREANAQRDAQAASGRVSNCAVERDPGAYCDRTSPPGGGAPAGVCRLGEAGGLRLPQVR